MAENAKEDNINSLCKKYFTPDACEEKVTESKLTLKRKLQEQLYKCGMAFVVQKFTINDADEKECFCFDVVEDSIEKFFEKGDEKAISKNFTSYFSAILWDFGLKAKKKLQARPLSLNTPVSSGEDKSSTLMDLQKSDERLSVENRINIISELQEVKAKFSFIEKCYRAKKRSDFLKSMITQRLYEDLHKYFTMIDEKRVDEAFVADSKARYTFIDNTVYNWKCVPTAKEIAAYLQKNEGQMSKAVNKFLDFVFEMYKKEGRKL